MGDYKLIDIKALKFKKISKEVDLLINSKNGKIESSCDIVIESVLKTIGSVYDGIKTPSHIYRIYKYSDCDESVRYGYKYWKKTEIHRGTLEELEDAMNTELLGIYFFSIGGFSWEPIRENDEEEN